MKLRIRVPKKLLLVAGIGVASVTLSGCDMFTSGNLVAPPPCDDAGSFDCTDAGTDAGTEQDAGSAEDGGTDEDGGADVDAG